MSCALLVTLLGGAGLITSSCTPEDQPGEEQKGPDDSTEEEETPSAPGTAAAFSKFISMISKGETIQIPLEGEWNLLYKGFKAGDKITITMVNDASVTFTLECTSADDVAGAVFTIPTKFIGGMCKVVAEAGGRTTTGTCFVEIVDTAEVEKKSGYTTYGRVVDYEAKPVAGVAVSDGALVTTTDSEGRYYLRSERKNVFVFISIPKNYRVAIDRAVPQFFQRFKSTRISTYEQHNFVLAPEENVKHRVLVWSDTHLANRTDDANQFKKFFKPDIEQQIAKAKSEGVKLYAIGLGDLAWDEFWYKNDYSLKDYREDISDFDLTIFSSPGNHDNDPSIADDFLAAAGFRENLNPLYYSFNIGDIHYIMMDNTLFKNSGATSNNYNVQDYTEGFTDDQMKWLKADLATVPEGTTIIFGLHIPWTNRSQANGNFTYAMPATFRAQVESLLSKYTVHFISGHTHTNYTNIINSKMREHNIAGVCGTWWWTGYYSKNKCRLNGDGSPSGYKIFDINGSDVKWNFKALARDASYQFRAYDLRNSLITRELYCPADKNKNVSDAFFSEYANGWDKSTNTTSTKKILINLFDYNDNWKITVTENGANLSVSRVEAYDPLHTIFFNMGRMNSNSTSMTFPTGKSAHFFEVSTSSATSTVIIKAEDPFGRVYEETMTRPRKLYDMSKEDKW